MCGFSQTVLVREQWDNEQETGSYDTFLPDLMYAAEGLSLSLWPTAFFVPSFERA